MDPPIIQASGLGKPSSTHTEHWPVSVGTGHVPWRVGVGGCKDIPFRFFLFGMRGLWDLVPQPGIKPVPPILEVQSLNNWTAREVPRFF